MKAEWQRLLFFPLYFRSRITLIVIMYYCLMTTKLKKNVRETEMKLYLFHCLILKITWPEHWYSFHEYDNKKTFMNI